MGDGQEGLPQEVPQASKEDASVYGLGGSAIESEATGQRSHLVGMSERGEMRGEKERFRSK